MANQTEKFREDHMMKLQGKDYLPVAPRVVLFRQEHPDWSIYTETKEVGDKTYVFATVYDPELRPIASAHKMVKSGGKGPAAQWPLETAETGAVGRALALCGYGTLAGDLDEGDQIADAPQSRDTGDKKAAPKAKRTKKAAKKGTPVEQLCTAIEKAKTKEEFDPLYAQAIDTARSLKPGDDDFELIKQTVEAAKKALGVP